MEENGQLETGYFCFQLSPFLLGAFEIRRTANWKPVRRKAKATGEKLKFGIKKTDR